MLHPRRTKISPLLDQARRLKGREDKKLFSSVFYFGAQEESTIERACSYKDFLLAARFFGCLERQGSPAIPLCKLVPARRGENFVLSSLESLILPP